MAGPPTLCAFEHPGFAAFGHPVFRLTSGDRVAAMAIRIDSADVVLPLRAIATLFEIRADSPDGQMLRLVEQALRFSTAIRLGDTLPSEVWSGEASWVPGHQHVKLAAAKLQLQLVNWIGGNGDVDDANITPQMLIAAADDPAIRPRVEEGLRRAASQLGLEGGGSAEVTRLLETAAGDLAYFEALREWLLDRVCGMTRRLARMAQESPALAAGRRETVFQVLRLAVSASTELISQFEAIDGETADILETLRDLGQRRSVLRPHRDRLYALLLAWQGVLDSWDGVPAHLHREPEAVWRIVDETYRFLAPRYMPVQSWQTFLAPPGKSERSRTSLIW
jgi:hypothetical protein